MKPIPRRISEPLILVGVVVIVLISLPLLGLVAFAGRGVLLVVAEVLVVAGIVLYAISPAFRAWFHDQAEGETSYGGLRLATDVALHPAHSWVRFDGAEAEVGADDLMQSVFGPVEDVSLPPAGKHMNAGEPLFTLRRPGRSLVVPSPVAGTVAVANASLPRSPDRINKTPFTDGWAVRMKVDSPRAERRALLRRSRARAWFRNEVERLRTILVNAGEPVATLPDGGVLVDDVDQQIDDATWDRLTETFFTARNVETAAAIRRHP